MTKTTLSMPDAYLPTLPIQYMDVCEAFVLANNGDIDELYQYSHIDRALFSSSHAGVSFSQLKKAFIYIYFKCNTSFPASLQVMQFFPLTAHGDLGLLALSAKNVGEALQAGVTFLPLLMPVFEIKVEYTPTKVCIYLDKKGLVGSFDYFFTEIMLFSVLQICPFAKAATPSPFGRGEVYFKHDNKFPVESYMSQFNLNFNFGATHNMIVFPSQVLSVPIATYSKTNFSRLYAILEKQMLEEARFKPVSREVKRRIKWNIDLNRAFDIEIIAEQMAMSRSTLARRLKKEGAQFTQLQNEVRFEYAKWLLQNTNKSKEEVARIVGFTNLYNFNRAYAQYEAASVGSLV